MFVGVAIDAVYGIGRILNYAHLSGKMSISKCILTRETGQII